MESKLTFYITIILVSLLIIFFIFKSINNNKKVKTQYDERQAAIRGEGFKYAFFTACISLAFFMVMDLSEIALPMSTSLIYFTVIMVSGLVLSSYSLWKDAYFGTNNNVNRFIIALVIITVFNAFFSIIAIKEDLVMENGILTDKFVNVECTIILAAILIQYAIKKALSGKEIGEDE